VPEGRSRRAKDFTSGHRPGRFNDERIAEAYRWGFRPAFPCRLCGGPMDGAGLDGVGNLCVRCDLCEAA
jgi:hypothetical protein